MNLGLVSDFKPLYNREALPKVFCIPNDSKHFTQHWMIMLEKCVAMGMRAGFRCVDMVLNEFLAVFKRDLKRI